MPTLDITLKLQDKAVKPRVFRFTRGSFGPSSQINFTIQKEDGSVYAITGLTLKMTLFEIWRRIAISQKELTIVSDVNGTAKYIPKEGDFGHKQDILHEGFIRKLIKQGMDRRDNL